MAGDDIVTVTKHHEALSQPEFLIKLGDKYYLTLALWEYDADRPDITPQQKADCEKVAEFHRASELHRDKGSPPPIAVLATANLGATNQHTTPPR